MPRSRSAPRYRIVRTAALVVSVVAALALAEVASRLALPSTSLPPPPPPSTIDPYEPNPYIVSRRPYLQMFLPGSRYRAERPSYIVDYEINSQGFRGPEIGPKTARRLVVVGDSIPEGHGVPFEESLVPQLEPALADGGWSVVSAAMQGGSPIHYAANLPRYLALEPDAVLLVLYENDLWDDRQKEAAYFDLPHFDDSAIPRLWTVARHALSGDSELERLIRANRGVTLAPSEPDPVTPIIVEPENFDRQWEMSTAYLDHLTAGLEERDVPLLVAVFALGTLVPRVPEAHLTYARRLEQTARSWSEDRGRPLLSLYPVTQDALAELPWEDVMIPDDGHPTPEMHRRMAAALGPWLRTNLP